DGASGCPDGAQVGGDGAPAEERLALFLYQPLQRTPDRGGRGLIARQEDGSHPVFPDPRQRDAERGTGSLEEEMGYLEEDAGAIAGVGLRAVSAAVGQVPEDPEALRHQPVRAATLDIDDETDTA